MSGQVLLLVTNHLVDVKATNEILEKKKTGASVSGREQFVSLTRVVRSATNLSIDTIASEQEGVQFLHV